jgi:hypothetical protein
MVGAFTNAADGGGNRRGGTDGAGGSAGWTTGDRAGLDGSLGGSDGRGAGSSCRTIGVDLDETRGFFAASFSAASLALASSSLLVGGSGGKVA